MKELGIKNIITGVFVLAGIAAFMVFSGVVDLGGQDQEATGTVTVWGTIPNSVLRKYIDRVKDQNLNINYIQKKTETYENDLINAFASGTGPDLFIMPYEGILRHSDKVLEVPYTSFPKNAYQSTYINEANLFLTDTGSIGVPMLVDPLVMYSNKALISSAFILEVPQYWDEFPGFASQVTQYSGTGEITISAAALGTYENIKHAKSLVSAMIMQNGVSIVGSNPINNKKQSTLASTEVNLNKTTQALDFYTSFAEFGANTYSWNEALVDAQNKFIAGEVALYFGRASEVENIRKKNPNLDFDVQLLPQVRSNTTRLTQGDMTGIAISKQTKNVPAAFSVMSKIAGAEVTKDLSAELLVAPTRKDLLSQKPDDTLRTLVFNSAIISAGWLDADPIKTNDLFRNMIRNINTGAQTSANAVSRAATSLNTVLDQTVNIRLN